MSILNIDKFRLQWYNLSKKKGVTAVSQKNIDKRDSGSRKLKRGAIMTGVVIGMGATFVLSSVISLFSKGSEARSNRKAKKEKEN